MGILDTIKDLFRKKEIHIDVTSLTPEMLDRASLCENQHLKAERDKLKKKIAEIEKTRDKIEEEKEVKIRLNERKQELEKVKSIKYFSLGKFFKDFHSRKLAGKLFFTDFEGGTTIDKVKDLGFTEDFAFVVIGKEQGPILIRRNLRDVFWSVKGMDTDVRAYKIRLCLNKNGEWQENIMVYDVPEMYKTTDGKIQYSSKKRPVYEIIAEKDTAISKLLHEIEEKENIIMSHESTIDELERTVRLNENLIETNFADSSQKEKSASNIVKAFNNMAQRLEQYATITPVLEDNIEKLENELEKMRAQAETEGVKLTFDKAIERVQQIKRDIVKDEPTREVHKVQESPKSQSSPIKP